MGLFQKIALMFTVSILTFGLDPLDSSAASSNPDVKKDVPGVETKVKQVPNGGASATPLWKVYWEKARQRVLLKKYPEAVQEFRKALALKSNLDEARLELAQVLITLERWGEAITEMET